MDTYNYALRSTQGERCVACWDDRGWDEYDDDVAHPCNLLNFSGGEDDEDESVGASEDLAVGILTWGVECGAASPFVVETNIPFAF